MEYRQVDGFDAYGFPEELVGHPLLAWMGEDYVRFVGDELMEKFRRQDADAELIALKCEQLPELSTSVDERSGVVRVVVAEFDLQVLLRASDGRHWRLRGDGKFTARDLDQKQKTSVTVGFNIRSNEPAD